MNKELLEKYHNDQCSREEMERVWEWFQTPEGEAYLEREIDRDIRMEEEFHDFVEYPDIKSDQLFRRIQKDKSDWRHNFTGWKKAVAAIVLIGFVSLFAVIFMQLNGTDKKVVETKPGEQKTLMMPDSSKIVLHSNSSLEYNSGFEKREVFLNGEAYFEVEHNDEHPFMVFVEDTYIKVLGTEFVVSEHADTERVKVAVKSGRVELGSSIYEEGSSIIDQLVDSDDQEEPQSQKDKPIEIFDNQVGVKDKNSTPFITDSVQYEEVFDWVDGKMIFQNTPMPQVVSELENRFAVQIVLKDQQLKEKKFTSSFDDETLDEILKVITLSFDVSYEKEGNKIFIVD